MPMRDERLEIGVTFDSTRGYIASARELRVPVVALSLGTCAGHRGRIDAGRPHHRAPTRRACRARAPPPPGIAAASSGTLSPGKIAVAVNACGGLCNALRHPGALHG